MRLTWAWTLLFTTVCWALPNTVQSATSLQVPAHTLVLYDLTEKEALRKACSSHVPVNGCVNRSTLTIHILKVTSFCDVVGMKTAGHEYMHLIGYNHDWTEYITPTVASTGCENGEYLKP